MENDFFKRKNTQFQQHKYPNEKNLPNNYGDGRRLVVRIISASFTHNDHSLH